MLEIIGAIVAFLLFIVLVISSWFSMDKDETMNVLPVLSPKRKKNKSVVFSEISNKRFIDNRGNITDQPIKTRPPVD